VGNDGRLHFGLGLSCGSLTVFIDCHSYAHQLMQQMDLEQPSEPTLDEQWEQETLHEKVEAVYRRQS